MTSHYKGIAAARVVEVIGLRNVEPTGAPPTSPPEFDNLTESQQAALRLLVAQLDATGEAAFLVGETMSGRGLIYSKGRTVPITFTDADFHELARVGLLTLSRVDTNPFQGQLTQRGLIAGRRAPLPGVAAAEPAVRLGPKPLAAVRPEADVPKLNVELIDKWMDDEGYDNNELAKALDVSVRTVSSLRNNGNYHGAAAITRLANLMERDPEEL